MSSEVERKFCEIVKIGENKLKRVYTEFKNILPVHSKFKSWIIFEFVKDLIKATSHKRESKLPTFCIFKYKKRRL